jgi:hypothetical protein
MVVESDGFGDAPASIMRFLLNGIPTMTVTQEWELWNRQWNLVRRESIAAERGFREVIEVKRTGRQGNGLASAVDWSRSIGRPEDVSGAFDLYSDLDADWCDACAGLRNAETAALNKWLGTVLMEGIACFLVPPPVTLPACLAASAAALNAAADYDKARADLANCTAAPPPCPPRSPAPGDCSLRAAGPHGSHASFDCTSQTGGGSGGTDGTGGSHLECTYYFEYDLYTGEILYSELLYCVSVPN